ncbi:hypothetical protein, partial [Chromobacterium amazonense]|uniref:hypothetical protein n=1 Tax=Chromobacterium amazonense TaxID=1382803 RepID=UPI003F7A081F
PLPGCQRLACKKFKAGAFFQANAREKPWIARAEPAKENTKGHFAGRWHGVFLDTQRRGGIQHVAGAGKSIA